MNDTAENLQLLQTAQKKQQIIVLPYICSNIIRPGCFKNSFLKTEK
jgi:hypothetical protein